jgi:hypothetical protein
MNGQEEEKYYRLLEKIISRRKGNSRYLSNRDGDMYHLEIAALLHYVNRLHPELADSLFSKEITLTRVPVVHEKMLPRYIRKTGKGNVFQFHDSRGNVRLLINAGTTYSTGKNSVIVLSDTLKGRNLSKYRQYLYLSLLQRDIEQVYRNMEARQRKQRPRGLGRVLPLDEKKSLHHCSGDFEKNFKALVREQGYGADSLLTAKILVSSMSPGDRSELNNNLLSNGVKNSAALERLLSRWKSEALLANQGHERIRPPKRTLAAAMER